MFTDPSAGSLSLPATARALRTPRGPQQRTPRGPQQRSGHRPPRGQRPPGVAQTGYGAELAPLPLSAAVPRGGVSGASTERRGPAGPGGGEARPGQPRCRGSPRGTGREAVGQRVPPPPALPTAQSAARSRAPAASRGGFGDPKAGGETEGKPHYRNTILGEKKNNKKSRQRKPGSAYFSCLAFSWMALSTPG